MNIELPYGKTVILLSIPKTHSYELVFPGEKDAHPDADDLIKQALHNPIDSRKLDEIAGPCDSISIIVSDTTRPVPTATMLRNLIPSLLVANRRKEDIRIVFALGIHRKQTRDERMQIVGKDIYDQFKCYDHDTERCTYLGSTSRNTPVEVFEPVVSSDVVICTGSIEHHYFAGYTGGYKALLPGVSSGRSIAANHALMMQAGTAPGNPDCPVRSDLEEGGAIAGVDFILNVILNNKKEIIGAVAGHPVQAHRRGAELVDDLFMREAEPADIVVVSPGGWPKDINVFQSHKALEHVKRAVKPGGAIILAAQCLEGIGNKVYEHWLDTTSGPQDAIRRLNLGFIQGGHKAALMGKLAEEFRLYLVSDLPADVAKKAYFYPASSLQDAFDDAASIYGPDARVVVVPYGGSTLVVGKSHEISDHTSLSGNYTPSNIPSKARE